MARHGAAKIKPPGTCIGLRQLLLLAPDPEAAAWLDTALHGDGPPRFRLNTAPHRQVALATLARHDIALVLLSPAKAHDDVLDDVRALRAAAPSVPLVLLCDHPEPQLARQALQLGAQDSLSLDHLDGPTLQQAIDNAILRHNAYHACERQLQRFEDFADCAADWYWEMDAELRFSQMSEAFLECTGLQLKQVIGHTREDIYAGHMPHETLRQHTLVLRRQLPFSNEFSLHREDGQQLHLLVSGTPVFAHDGRFLGYRGAGRDITAHKQLEMALRRSEQRFRDFAAISADWFWEMDANLRFSYLSGKVEEIMGLPTSHYIDRTRSEVYGNQPDTELSWRPLEAITAARQPIDNFDMDWQRPDGQWRHVILNGKPLFDEQGRFLGYRGTGRDASLRHRIKQSLAEKSTLLELTFQHIDQAISVVDSNLNISAFNQRFLSLLNFPESRFQQGMPLENYFRFNAERGEYGPGDPDELVLERMALARNPVAHRMQRTRPDGTVLDIRGSPLPDGGFVTTYTDVTESHQLSEKLSWQASHDWLTGLINRRAFEQRLRRVLEDQRKTCGEHALCYLDLDQFKVVNDTCGHIAGDELLRQISAVLEQQVRKRDNLARLGGDEFALLMEHCPLEQAQRVADALQHAVNSFRFHWEGKRFQIGVSIGLVPITENHLTLSEILGMADSACYAAKELGRNRTHLFRSGDAGLIERQGQMRWVMRLQDALEQQQLELYWQPIVSLGKPISDAPEAISCELLMRLREADGSLVCPSVFLTAAERYDLAPRLDRWVINAAFGWLADHRDRLEHLGFCTINLSGQTLGSEHFEDFVLERLQHHRLPADKLCFEITETAAISNLASATRFMQALKDQGCCFALDDFGSGLSSFAYLRNLPVDYLKIDGQFIRGIANDPVDLALVRSINDIGHVMRKQTIAEFAESPEVVELLRELGVDYVQGFAIGKPQSLDSFPER